MEAHFNSGAINTIKNLKHVLQKWRIEYIVIISLGYCNLLSFLHKHTHNVYNVQSMDWRAGRKIEIVKAITSCVLWVHTPQTSTISKKQAFGTWTFFPTLIISVDNDNVLTLMNTYCCMFLYYLEWLSFPLSWKLIGIVECPSLCKNLYWPHQN